MAGKAFRFPLDQVLTLRQHAAAAAERDLAAAIARRQGTATALDQADARLRRLADAGRAPGAGTPACFRRHAAVQHEALHARATARATLDAARQGEATARTTLVGARRGEESIRTLRTEAHEAHARARARAEAASLDERASAAYCRHLLLR